MKFSRIKIIQYLINAAVILSLLGFGYYYRVDIGRLLNGLLNQLQPCQRPIAYSIANLDPRFGLTKAEVLADIQKAEKIWESPINRQLFEYSPTGDLKINFIYDYRQKATNELQKMGIALKDDQSTYNALKAKYNSLVVSYDKEKAQLDILLSIFNADKSAYEKDISYWNSRGGAPKEEYAVLEQKKNDLNNQIAIINQTKDALNGLADAINSAGMILNKLIATLNLQVSKYNTVGASTGKEFNEGEYVRDAGGTVINIFQFNDNNQLVRVLAHELGHALGIDHLANPKAIMYYLNEGGNEKLTADDLSALKTLCGIK
jgi:hypothetical protein